MSFATAKRKKTPLSSDNKKSRLNDKNRFICNHLLPRDPTLECFVFHQEGPGYAENPMAWAWYNRNSKPGEDILNDLDCHMFIHHLTDGHGSRLKNNNGYDIRIFIKPIAEDFIGKTGVADFKDWFDKVCLPTLHKNVPDYKDYQVPNFNVSDYREHKHWCDIFGTQHSTNDVKQFPEIQRVIKEDYAKPEQTFGEWLNEHNNGNRFYSLFRDGFVPAQCLELWHINPVILQKTDKAAYDTHMSSRFAAQEANDNDDNHSVPGTNIADAPQVNLVSPVSENT